MSKKKKERKKEEENNSILDKKLNLISRNRNSKRQQTIPNDFITQKFDRGRKFTRSTAKEKKEKRKKRKRKIDHSANNKAQIKF